MPLISPDCFLQHIIVMPFGLLLGLAFVIGSQILPKTHGIGQYTEHFHSMDPSKLHTDYKISGNR